jgi:cysteine-rich repeat protein
MIKPSTYAGPFALSVCFLATILGGACGGGGESSTGFTGAGASGSTGGSGSTGSGPASCGNGKPEAGKVCDPSIKDGMGGLEGLTCENIGKGFTGGTLTCTEDCTLNTTACTKTVNCFDGTTTCANPACTAECADPCGTDAVLAAPDPSTQMADTTSHPGKLDSKCSSSSGTGPNLVYQVKAATAGVLAIDLESDVDLGVSARTSCADATTEVACIDHFVSGSFEQHLVVPCTAGQVVFIVVGGYGPTDAGDFTLSIKSRPIVCGDGFRDPGEQCDDGNTASGDGCSSTCQLEPTETEPNNTVAQANAYSSPWYAQLSPAGDVDVVSVQVTSPPAGITATLSDFNNGYDCEAGTMEAVLQIIGPDGTTMLAHQDFGLTDACGSVSVVAEQAGTYYVTVAASMQSASPTFPYKLDVTAAASTCGNGMVDPGEQCDPPSATCSGTCQFVFAEKEPNNTSGTANPFTGSAADPWYAQISPAMDVDYVSFAVPAGTTQISVIVDDNGDGDCEGDKIVAKAELLAPDGATVLASNQGGASNYCPSLMVAPMGASFAAGTYFVRVSAGPLEAMATFDYRLRIELEP